jgi:hypothetical protein
MRAPMANTDATDERQDGQPRRWIRLIPLLIPAASNTNCPPPFPCPGCLRRIPSYHTVMRTNMRGLVVRRIYPTMPDPRGAMHHPHPSPHGYPAYPGPGYPPSGSGPAYHRPSGRHVSNGPPPPVMVGGPPPPPMAMGGPPPEALIAPPPPSAPIGNGHAHGPPSLPNASPAVRKAREDMDSLMGKLAHANENTWMLIGELSIASIHASC